MGNNPSSPLANCLNAVCDGRSGCVGYPSNPLYQITWVKPYNLDLIVEPIAVARPETAEDVSGFVMCAATHGVKVQPKGGGHSYANFGLGGKDGELVLDMVKMQHFEMDKKTWKAKIGPGHRLHDVTEKLYDNGGRAMSHGTCPGVGIGGHATIGGLGPSSRMWGSCLDHVLEVEVVLADGTITRASEKKNPDLFFALKGAGAGFGVITEFVVKTHPSPKHTTSYSFTHTFTSHSELAPLFTQWQTLISDPDLDRRFSSEFVLHELGAVITATFFGSEEEFDATGIPDKLPKGKTSVVVDDWLGVVHQQAQDAALWLSEMPAPFTAKSLAFRQEDLLPADGIEKLMHYIDDADRGTLIWFLIFDVTGGAISDVPMNATAYAHRDKIMFCQGYGVGIPEVSDDTRNFLDGIVSMIRKVSPNGDELATYAGYVDPSLENAQERYWGPNLDRLMDVKAAFDPKDLFHNPQSVRPASSKRSLWG